MGAVAKRKSTERKSEMQINKPAQVDALVPSGHEDIFEKLAELYRELFEHNGYGALRVEMRFLKKGQKEIFVISGKEYRFVVDYPGADIQADQSQGAKGGNDETINGKNRKTVKAEKEVAEQ